MPTIEILIPYQPWFMIIRCDEFAGERDANLFLEVYIHDCKLYRKSNVEMRSRANGRIATDGDGVWLAISHYFYTDIIT